MANDKEVNPEEEKTQYESNVVSTPTSQYEPNVASTLIPNAGETSQAKTSLLEKKVKPQDLDARRILNDEQIEVAKNYFNQNQDAKKFSRKEKNGLPFSVIKTNAGKLFALYHGKEFALGTGSFGAVKLAQDIDSGEWVSIKVQNVTKNIMHDKILSSIDAENKIQDEMNQFKGGQKRDAIDKKFLPSTKAYTVMKFIPAQEFAKQQKELQNKLEALMDPTAYSQNPIEWQRKMLDFVSFSTKVAATTTKDLATLHEKNIIHRDLHTGNILVDNSGHGTIIDFGLSIKVDPITKTQEAWVGGRRDILSPEILAAAVEKRKYQYSPTDDMWSLGKCIEVFQLANTILYFGNDIQIPHDLQKNVLLMIGRLNDKTEFRPMAEKLSQHLETIANYAILAKGINLKNSTKDDINAYRTIAQKLGPSNNFSTVNIIDKKGNQLTVAKGLKYLNIQPTSNKTIGVPIHSTQTQEMLLQARKKMVQAFNSHSNINAELSRQYVNMNKQFDLMMSAGKLLDAKILLDHLHQDIKPQLEKNESIGHGINMDIKIVDHQLQRIEIAPLLHEQMKSQTTSTKPPKENAAKVKSIDEKIPSKRVQPLTFSARNKEKSPSLASKFDSTNEVKPSTIKPKH